MLQIRSLTILLLFAFVLAQEGMGQNQKHADSLISVYESDDYPKAEKLQLLKNITTSLADPDEKLAYSELIISEAISAGDSLFLIDGYMAKGTALRLKGVVPDALESYFLAADIATNRNMERTSGLLSVIIADAYSTIDNYDLALDYYNVGIGILRTVNDSINLASALYNAGDHYFKKSQLDSALLYFQESGIIFRDQDYTPGVAYNVGSIGQVHASLNHYKVAENNLNNAIQMLTILEDWSPVSEYVLTLAEVYFKQGLLEDAARYANRSLELAITYGLKKQISEANLMLSLVYEKLSLEEKALDSYRKHIIYRDSLKNIKAIEEMANLRSNYEIRQKQAEVDLLRKEAQVADLRGKRQQWGIAATILILLLVAVLGINTYRRYQFARKTNKIIEREKNRSEDLLLNILPRETAVELREKGEVQARKIDNVTVLFTDFIEFTKHAEKESPEQMVKSIDYYFKQFDEITTRYKLEKIKTIGDSYMCAGGLHSEHCQAKEVIKAALEMMGVLEKAKNSNDVILFNMRIGIHTGPVVAGIVGTKKWQYDIWGDTVNIASGMEAKSESGKVNISQTTFEEVKDEYLTEYRGEINIKNRGVVKMYFIS